jgi:hypothetical protein
LETIIIQDNLKKIAAKVYVILLNWNGYKDVDNCLRSLMKSSYEVEIVVVDNFSTERDIEKIVCDFPEVKFIQNIENSGFGKGNNLGINYALAEEADYVYILNSDTIVTENSIYTLLEFMENNTGTVAVSSLVLYGDDHDIIWYGGGDFSWRNGGSRSIRANSRLRNSDLNTPERVKFMTGCSMFIRASALKKIGGFDEHFFMYVEDVDMSIRLSELGSMYIIPDSIIFHYAHSTAKKEIKEKFRNLDSPLNPNLCFYVREILNGYFYLVKKHNPKLTERAVFYIYFYIRWLKKAVTYVIKERMDAFIVITRILLNR